MKNSIKHIVNNHESAVSSDLFDRIMSERKRQILLHTRLRWALALSIFFLSASAVYWFATQDTAPFNADTTTTASAKITGQSNTKSITHTPKKQTSTTRHHHTISPTPQTWQSRMPAKDPAFNQKTTIPALTKKAADLAQRKAALSTPSKEIKAKQPGKSVRPLPGLLAPLLRDVHPVIAYTQPGDCYSFTKRKGNNHFFVDLLGAPDYVIPNIIPKSSEFENYVTERNQTENYVFSYSGQLGLGLETEKGIVIRLGLNYSRYQSRFRKSDPNFKKVSIEQIFDNQGNLLRNDTVTTFGSLDIQHFNSHQYLGIPLTLGYTTSGHQLDIGFNAGLQFNIQTQSKGRFIGADSQTTPLTIYRNSAQPAYKSQIGWQAIANLSLAYEISDHIDILFAPHIKYTPNTITTAFYPLDEKLTTIGLWIGGRIRF